MRISEVGEFGLIDRLAGLTGPGGEGVELGIGDDAAVLRPSPGARLLATCDMLLEGVHFDLSLGGGEDLGHRALAASLSDIAAMGGQARWALVSLGLPAELPVQLVEDVYRGMTRLGRVFGVTVVGGDTCRSPHGLVLDVTVLGEAGRYVFRRSAARPGDYLAVTGPLGGSAAGLLWCQAGRPAGLPEAAREAVLAAHFAPVPRLREAEALQRYGEMVGAVDDVSDGLASEAHEIAAASGVSLVLLAGDIPIGPGTRAAARLLGRDPLELALRGGEDYELLVTLRGNAMDVENLREHLRMTTGTELTVIGRVEEGSGVRLVHADGHVEDLAAAGYNHFRVEEARG